MIPVIQIFVVPIEGADTDWDGMFDAVTRLLEESVDAAVTDGKERRTLARVWDQIETHNGRTADPPFVGIDFEREGKVKTTAVAWWKAAIEREQAAIDAKLAEFGYARA